MTLRGYECSLKFLDVGGSRVNARSAGAARYQYLLNVRESYPDATFADVRVRSLGPPVQTGMASTVARLRGRPELRCGTRVRVTECGGDAGSIVDGTMGANFMVLFEEGVYAGRVLAVHPAYLEVRPESEVW